MLVWRVSKAGYAGEAFNGEGAARWGGRWNGPDYEVVYTSETLSLAALEYFVNMEPGTVPADVVAVTAEIPESVKILSLRLEDVPGDWRAYPAPPSTRRIGMAWLEKRESAVLAVPSVVIPSERNYLLNPAHPQFRKVRVGKPERFGFDSRMWKGRG